MTGHFEIPENSEASAAAAVDQTIGSIRRDLRELSDMFACLSPDDEDLDGNDLYGIIRAKAAIERGLALTSRRLTALK